MIDAIKFAIKSFICLIIIGLYFNVLFLQDRIERIESTIKTCECTKGETK